MAIPYERIPRNLRVPGMYSEINNSRAIAGAQLLEYRRLIIGTMLPAGSATPEVPVQCLSVAQAEGLFGAGSVAAGMVEAALAQDDFTDLIVMPLADPSAGAAATATITVTGTATAAGTLALYVAGRQMQIGVAATDTPTLVAGKIVAAITGDASLPVTAANTAGVVTLTAKNKGETGNQLEARVNYFGETLPAGTSYAITAFSGGTGNPSIDDALAALGDGWYQAIATAYTDASNLVLIEQDQFERWGPLREVEGHVFAAARGTVASLGTLGNSRNSEHLTIVQAIKEPTPAYEKAAETMAIFAFSASNDPARPVQNLPYLWSKPAAEPDRLTLPERNISRSPSIS